jgi:uncharacterized protein DUF3224
MEKHAKGSFEVKMTPKPWSDNSDEHGFGRFMLDKQYHGDLEAAGVGQMLTAGNGAPGSSGAYVALEKITGSVDGRKGAFVVYHLGIMNRGVPELKLAIVPESGSGELQGIGGTITIAVADGKHSYDFAYTLATIE